MNSKPMEVKKRRNNNPNLLKIADAFEPAHINLLYGTCGNIKSQVEPIGDDWVTSGYDKTLGGSTSAPYVLARLCAMFKGLDIETYGQEEYKVTWTTVLIHKETGNVVTFYDWKGGISYGSNVYGKNAPKSFIRDLKKLIKALKDDRFPHPYDGCVVGEIA